MPAVTVLVARDHPPDTLLAMPKNTPPRSATSPAPANRNAVGNE